MAISPPAKAPLWVLLVLGAMTALPLVFTVLVYTKPVVIFGSVWSAFPVPGAMDLTGPVGFYLSRNVATIAASIYALGTRSVPMLKVMLLLRVVTETMDGIHFAIGGGAAPPTITPFVIAAVELAAFLRIVNIRG